MTDREKYLLNRISTAAAELSAASADFATTESQDARSVFSAALGTVETLIEVWDFERQGFRL